MRLLLGFLMLCISGCNLLSPAEYNKEEKLISPKIPKNVINKIPSQSGSTVKLINKTKELLSKSFKDRGIISGISCQPNRQAPIVSIPIAKKTC